MRGVFFMCRKNHARGWALLALGFGTLVGFCIDSWLLCALVGLGLMGLGAAMMRKR